jgi:hypothetical protein
MSDRLMGTQQQTFGSHNKQRSDYVVWICFMKFGETPSSRESHYNHNALSNRNTRQVTGSNLGRDIDHSD